ncbi:MAG: hypothetical protein M1834_005089 [Cirrosporium novae-zelandiae]|nr:MAG: hypothetical protein M1834_005089 [Cirrosporium novae-zelandiae]
MATINQKSTNGLLELVQSLLTTGARAVDPFTVNGLQYIAIPQLAKDIPDQPVDMTKGDSDVKTLIFKFKENKWKIWQRLLVNGGEDAEVFIIGDRQFLATASFRVGSDPYDLDVDSTIFEWKEGGFYPFQQIPRYAAKQCRHFEIQQRHFLALAQGVVIEGVTRKNPAKSTIFEWDGSSFVSFQTVTGRAFCFFEANNDAYLAFANLMDRTLLYRWSGECFNVHQTLSGPGGREFAIFYQDTDLYMIQVNFLTGSGRDPNPTQESVIYRFQGDKLVMVDTFTTSGATDAKVLDLNGRTLVAVSESMTAEVHFKTDSHIFRLLPSASTTRPKSRRPSVYQNLELVNLFHTYTAGSDGIGAHLSSKAFISSFRLSTKGFKELAAVFHLGPAMASLVSMHTLNPMADLWRSDVERLLRATEEARKVNTAYLWSDKIAVEAYRGREDAIASMIDYGCAITIRFLGAVLDDSSKLNAKFLREAVLEAIYHSLGASVPFNSVMIATFFLTGMDISYRATGWLNDEKVDWSRAMVLIIRGASGGLLPLDHMYIAPHAPSFNIADLRNIDAIQAYEQPMRSL